MDGRRPRRRRRLEFGFRRAKREPWAGVRVCVRRARVRGWGPYVVPMESVRSGALKTRVGDTFEGARRDSVIKEGKDSGRPAGAVLRHATVPL